MATFPKLSATSLPPAFTARERAIVDATFGKAGRAARAARASDNRSSLAVAVAAVALAIGLMFTVHGPASPDRIPASAGWFDVASR